MITIIGQKGVGKTTLFRQIMKKFSTRAKQKTSPLVNYVEELISIKNNTYKLVDTPSFALSPKTEIEEEIRKQTEELLKKSDLIF
jgi:predicted GTPase